MFFTLIKFVVGLVFIAFIILWGRTWQIEHSKNQSIFASGKVPNPLPSGLYSGSVPGHKVSWLGKKFDATSSTGINVFQQGSTTVEEYPFKTYVGKGLRDKGISVLKIDYNSPSNPFWLRFILDEIVEVSPGQYLGKLHVIIATFPFTLGYFELKK